MKLLAADKEERKALDNVIRCIDGSQPIDPYGAICALRYLYPGEFSAIAGRPARRRKGPEH